MLVIARNVFEALGYSQNVREAKRRLSNTVVCIGRRRYYDLDAVRQLAEQIGGEKCKTRPINAVDADDGRWKPDHPGPWTDEDIAEFNRRHPFLRDFLEAMRRKLTLSKNNRVSKCKGRFDA